MKRLAFLLLVWALLLILAPLASAVGTVVIDTPTKISVLGQSQRVVLTLTCTADSSTGSFPATTINPVTYGITGFYLYSVETDPGTTAPTDNYDITIVDSNGYDVAGGLLANRDTISTELVYMSSVGYPMITGSWTWTMTNNSVSSATVVAKLTFTAN